MVRSFGSRCVVISLLGVCLAWSGAAVAQEAPAAAPASTQPAPSSLAEEIARKARERQAPGAEAHVTPRPPTAGATTRPARLPTTVLPGAKPAASLPRGMIVGATPNTGRVPEGGMPPMQPAPAVSTAPPGAGAPPPAATPPSAIAPAQPAIVAPAQPPVVATPPAAATPVPAPTPSPAGEAPASTVITPGGAAAPPQTPTPAAAAAPAPSEPPPAPSDTTTPPAAVPITVPPEQDGVIEDGPARPVPAVRPSRIRTKPIQPNMPTRAASPNGAAPGAAPTADGAPPQPTDSGSAPPAGTTPPAGGDTEVVTPTQPPVPDDGRSEWFNFDGIPWEDVLTYFAERLGKPWMNKADLPVSGELTFKTTRRFTPEEAVDELNLLLHEKGLRFMTIGDYLYLKELAEIPPLLPTDRVFESRDAFEHAELRSMDFAAVYVSIPEQPAQQIVDMFGDYLPPGAYMIAESAQNRIRIRALVRDIRRILTLIDRIRSEKHDPRDIRVFTVRTNARDMENVIRTMVGAASPAVAGQPRQRWDPQQNRFVPTGGGDGDESILITADDRTNSLIVKATKETLDEVAKTLEQLDKRPDIGEFTWKVFEVKYGNARDISDMLSAILQQEGAQTGAAQLPAWQQQQRIRQMQQRMRPGQPGFQPGQPVQPGQVMPGQENMFGFTEDLVERAKKTIRQVPDERTNSLIVYANTDGHKRVEEILEVVDKEQPSNFRVIKLEHVDADEIVQTVQQIAQEMRTASAGSAPRTLSVTADSLTNSLYLIADREQMRDIEEIVKAFDVEQTTDNRHVIQLKNVAPSEVMPWVQSLLAAGGGTAPTVNPAFQRRGFRPPTGGGGASVAGRSGSQVIAIDEAGLLIVVCSDNDWEKIDPLIREWDAGAADNVPDTRQFTILQGDAANIANTLRSLYQQYNHPTLGQSRVTVAQDADQIWVHAIAPALEEIGALIASMDVAPAVDPLTILPLRYADANTVAQLAQPLVGGSGGRGGRFAGPGNSVQAEPTTNSLIVRADETTLERVKQFAADLDAKAGAEQPVRKLYSPQHLQTQQLRDAIAEFFSGGRGSGGRFGGISAGPQVKPVIAGAQVVVEMPQNKVDDVEALVRSIDVPADGDPVVIVPLTYTDAQAVAQQCQALLPPGSSGGGFRGAPSSSGPSVTPETTTNSLVIRASEPLFALIKAFVDDLEAKAVAGLPERRILTPKNTPAREIADALNGVFGSRGGGGRFFGSGGGGAGPQAVKVSVAGAQVVVEASADKLAEIEALFRQLDDPGDREIVIKTVTLPKLDVQQVANKLSNAFGERARREGIIARFDADPTTETVLITVSRSELTEVERLLAEFEAAGEGLQRDTAFRKLNHATAQAAAQWLRDSLTASVTKQYGRNAAQQLSIQPDDRTNRVIISGPQVAVKQGLDLLEQFDVATEEATGGPDLLFTEARKLPGLNVENLARRLQESFDARPARPDKLKFKFSGDALTENLLITAPKDQKESIDALIAQLSADAAELAVTERFFDLKHADATVLRDQARELLTARVAKRAGREVADRINIVAEPRLNRLIVNAPKMVIPDAEALVTQLDQPETSPIVPVPIDLKYLEPNQAKAMVDQLYGSGRAGAQRGTNPYQEVSTTAGIGRLIVKAPADKLGQIKALLASVDVEAEGLEVRTYQLKVMDATQVAVAVQGALQSMGIQAKPGQMKPNAFPEPTTNSIVVLAPKEVMSFIDALVLKFESANVPTPELRTYALKNARATQVQTNVDTLLKAQAASNKRMMGARVQPSVVADPATNRLVVYAPEEYQELAQELIATIDREESAAGDLVRILPLADANADELARALQQVLPRGDAEKVRITADSASNALLLAGLPKDVAYVEKLVTELAASSSTLPELQIFKLENADALELSDQLIEMFPSGRTAAELVTFSTDEYYNRLIVTAGKRKMRQIEGYVKALDAAPEVDSTGGLFGGGRTLRIVDITRGNADDIAFEVRSMLPDRDSGPEVDSDWDGQYLKVVARDSEYPMIEKLIRDVEKRIKVETRVKTRQLKMDADKVLQYLVAQNPSLVINRPTEERKPDTIVETLWRDDESPPQPEKPRTRPAGGANGNGRTQPAGEEKRNGGVQPFMLNRGAIDRWLEQAERDAFRSRGHAVLPLPDDDADAPARPPVAPQRDAGSPAREPAEKPHTEPASRARTLEAPTPPTDLALDRGAPQYPMSAFRFASADDRFERLFARANDEQPAPTQPAPPVRVVPATPRRAPAPAATEEPPPSAKPVTAGANEPPGRPRTAANQPAAERPATPPPAAGNAPPSQSTHASAKPAERQPPTIQVLPDNRIVIVGEETPVEDLEDLIDSFEEDMAEGEVIRIFKFKYGDVTTAADILDRMFNDRQMVALQAAQQQQQQAQQAAQRAQQQQQQGRGGEGDKGNEAGGLREQLAGMIGGQRGAARGAARGGAAVRIATDASHSYLITKCDASELPKIRELLRELDIPPAKVDLRVIQLKQLDAEETAANIKEVLGMNRARQRGAGGGAQPRNPQQQQLLQVLQQQMVVDLPGMEGGGAKIESVEIIPNKITNALLISAPPEVMDLIEDVVQRLESLEERDIVIIKHRQLETARLEDVLPLLQDVFSSAGGGGGGPPGAGRAVNKPASLGPVTISGDPRNNTLIYTCQAKDVEYVEAQIDMLDIEGKVAEAELYVCQFGDAPTIAEAIRGIFVQGGAAGGGGPGRALRGGGGAGGVSDDVRIESDSVTNSILVFAPKPQRETIFAQIRELDQLNQRDIREIPVRNADPEKLAEKLTEVFAGSSAIGGGTARGGRRGGGQPGAALAGAAGGGRVVIIGDAPAKKLLVKAPDNVYDQIVEMVELLDAPNMNLQIRRFALKHANADVVVSSVEDGMLKFMTLARQGDPQFKLDAFTAVPDPRTNSIVVVGSDAVFAFVGSLLNEIDQPTPDEAKRVVRIFPLEKADPQTVAEAINALSVSAQSTGGGGRRGGGMMSRGGGGMPTGELDVTAMPEPATNSVIVSGRPADVALVEATIIKQFEAQIDALTRPTTIVLQNAKPSQVAEFIQRFVAPGEGPGGRGGGREAGITPTIVPNDPAMKLIVKGTPAQVDRIKMLATEFDDAALVGQQIKVVEVPPGQNAEDLARSIQDILNRGESELARKEGREPRQIALAAEPYTDTILGYGDPILLGQVDGVISQLRNVRVGQKETRIISLTNLSADDALQMINDLQSERRGAGARTPGSRGGGFTPGGGGFTPGGGRFTPGGGGGTTPRGGGTGGVNRGAGFTPRGGAPRGGGNMSPDGSSDAPRAQPAPTPPRGGNAPSNTADEIRRRIESRQPRGGNRPPGGGGALLWPAARPRFELHATHELDAATGVGFMQPFIGFMALGGQAALNKVLREVDDELAGYALAANTDERSAADAESNDAASAGANAQPAKDDQPVEEADVESVLRELRRRAQRDAATRPSGAATRPARPDRPRRPAAATQPAERRERPAAAPTQPAPRERAAPTPPAAAPGGAPPTAATATSPADDATTQPLETVTGSLRGDITATPLGSQQIIISGDSDDLDFLEAILQRVQISGPRPLLEVFKLENAKAPALAQTLERAMTQYIGTSVARQGPEDRVSIAAEARSNSLIVTASEKYMDMIAELITRLDTTKDGEATQFKAVPLQNVKVGDVAAKISATVQSLHRLRGETESQPQIETDERSNSILIMGTGKDIEEIERLIQTVDVEISSEGPGGFTRGDMVIIGLQNGVAEDIAKTLTDMIKAEQDAAAQQAASGGQGGGARGALPIRKLRLTTADGRELPELDLEKPIRILSEKGTNSLIIYSVPKNNEALKEIVGVFDTLPLGADTEVRAFVLKHAQAEAVATVLTDLFEKSKRAIKRPGEGGGDTIDRGQLPPIPSNVTGKGLPYNVFVQHDARSNTVFVIGRKDAVLLAGGLINEMDLPGAELAARPRVIDLKNMPAATLEEKLKTLLEERAKTLGEGDQNAARDSAVVIPDERSNSLIVLATDDMFRMISELAHDLDEASAYRIVDTRVRPLKYADAAKIQSLLQEVFDKKKQAKSDAGSTTAGETKDALFITADPRSNALMLTGTRDYLAEVEQLINNLDQSFDPTMVFKVRPVKLNSAANIAALLTDVIDKAKPGEGGAEGSRLSGTPIYISADAVSDNLLIAASAEDLLMIERWIDALDRPTEILRQVRVIPLARGKAEDIAKTAQELFKPPTGTDAKGGIDVTVTHEPTSNAIIAVGPSAVIQDIEDIVRRLDRIDSSAGAVVRMFKLKQADAETAGELLTAILEGRSGSIGGGTGRGGTGGGAGANDEAAKNVMLIYQQMHPEVGVETLRAMRADVRVISDLRTNSLVVVAPAESMTLMESLVAAVDVPPDAAKIRVFPLRNADAEEMVKTLEGLFQGAAGTSGSRSTTGGTAGGTTIEEGGRRLALEGGTAAAGEGREELAFTVDVRTNSVIAAGTKGYLDLVEELILELDTKPIEQIKTTVYVPRNNEAASLATSLKEYSDAEKGRLDELGEEISAQRKQERQIVAIANEDSNTLILGYSPRFESDVMAVVRELDQPPPQVMIQVLILEVTMGNSLELGVEFSFQDLQFAKAGPTDTTTFDYVGGADLGAAGLGGFTFTITGADFNFLFRTLQKQNSLKVLSRPQIVAMDNQEASIRVTNSVPYVSATSTSIAGQVSNSISREDVGIELTVTPQINPDGYVRMEIEQVVSDFSPDSAVPVGPDLTAPVFFEREARTHVTVKDGETVVLGGLITSRESRSEDKIPIVGDIPGLGLLFRRQSDQVDRTDLLIVLTPRIVRTVEDYRQASIDAFEDMDVITEDPRSERLFRKLRGEPEEGPGYELSPPGIPHRSRPAKPAAPRPPVEDDEWSPTRETPARPEDIGVEDPNSYDVPVTRKYP